MGLVGIVLHYAGARVICTDIGAEVLENCEKNLRENCGEDHDVKVLNETMKKELQGHVSDK